MKTLKKLSQIELFSEKLIHLKESTKRYTALQVSNNLKLMSLRDLRLFEESFYKMSLMS